MIETRRAPGGHQCAQRPCFLFVGKVGKRKRGVPRHQAKVSVLGQQDQDRQDGKTEVTMEPKAASPPEPFAGEDHYFQDKLY